MLALTISIVGIDNLSTEVNHAFAETLEWNSHITAGILPTEPSEFDTRVVVSTYSTNALKLEWQEPDLPSNKVTVGYEILRRTIDTEYLTVVKITESTKTSYIDVDLPKGYYGYQIIPIIENKQPEPISMHGIDRNHSMFETYVKGQELLAKTTLNEIMHGKSIQNDSLEEPKTYYYDPIARVDDPLLQSKIIKEIIRAIQLFDLLFDVHINH